MEQEKHFRHICTAGLEKEIIFKTDADYIFEMNSIPVCMADKDISMHAFCLMDNHVHFIAHGSEEDCGGFIKAYRKRLFTLADMSRADICMKEIDDTEYLKRAIAYVLRNPPAAGLAVLPTHYRWSSGPLYFNDGNTLTVNRPVTDIAHMSRRRQQKLFRTRGQLPGHYTVTADGLICPGCYVDYRAVEEIFRSPVRMLYFLSRNDSMEMELTSGILRRARYTDSEMASTVTNLCSEIFSKSSPDALSIDEKYQLADILGNNTVWASSSWHVSPIPASVCSDKFSTTAKALQTRTFRCRTAWLRIARITTLKDKSPNPAQSRRFPQR